MKIKVPVANPTIGIKEAKLVFKKIKSGWISMGPEVRKFEKKVQSFLGVKHAIAVNNGTSALDALLTALDIKPGDEVIVPSLTYISSANVVKYKNAKLVLCDVNENTFNTEVKEVEKKITKKTKLIIVTDLKGMPVDYDRFKKLSKKTNIPIIADSAESFGAKYNNKFVGSQLLAHTFSFFANKNLTTGEGGMIVTNNNKLEKKLRIIRNQGQNKRYNHVVLGNNFRMTDISASIGIVQLSKIKSCIRKKNKIANKYDKGLKDTKLIKTPFIPKYVSNHSWYNYCIKVPKNKRNKLMKYLNEKSIETRLSFPPIHIQPFYKKEFKKQKKFLKKSLEAFEQFIDIPIWPDLSKIKQDYVIKSINEFFRKP